jgi:hypothetical protein
VQGVPERLLAQLEAIELAPSGERQ